jgi:L-iditol 2-dehydrogenase
MGHESVCDTLRTTSFEPGGFSEYLRVPAINVEKGTYLLPDNMSYDEGTFLEPLACVVRGQRHARVSEGQSVLVIGSGMSGLLHILLAVARGAGPVFATDVSEYRMRAAEKAGAVKAIHASEDVPARVKELNGGRLADVVILCAGAEAAVKQAMDSVGRGGTLLLFAPPPPDTEFTVPLMDYWKNEITVTTSYAGPPEEIREAMDLISSGKVSVKELITHRLPLERTQEGFGLVVEGGESIKVIIEPHGKDG